MKIAIIGTGYVGLTSGTCFAEIGHTVICVDTNEEKIARLQKGRCPIYEPGLEDLIKKNQKNGRLKFTTNTKEAVEFAEIVFSAVGTPPEKSSNKPDLSFVKQVAQAFGKHLTGYKIFINKSTVPVGTADLCKEIIEKEIQNRNNASFNIVSNPEFLREGQAIKDTLEPDRIVVGTDSSKAQKVMQKLYGPTENVIFTDIRSAEIIKYASNAFLATKISFINEVANFCELAGGNIEDIAKAMGADSRIGSQFLNAGIGYGGSCFPKDVNALIETGRELGHDFQILKATNSINESQKALLYYKLRNRLGPLQGKIIAIWGLAFKPNTDDMREAPSLTLIRLLQADGAIIRAYDPVATETAQKLIEPFNITFAPTPYDAAINASALLLLTEWDEFKNPDLNKLKTLMHTPLILDGRNCLNKNALTKKGFTYIGIGQEAATYVAHAEAAAQQRA